MGLARHSQAPLCVADGGRPTIRRGASTTAGCAGSDLTLCPNCHPATEPQCPVPTGTTRQPRSIGNDRESSTEDGSTETVTSPWQRFHHALPVGVEGLEPTILPCKRRPARSPGQGKRISNRLPSGETSSRMALIISALFLNPLPRPKRGPEMRTRTRPIGQQPARDNSPGYSWP